MNLNLILKTLTGLDPLTRVVSSGTNNKMEAMLCGKQATILHVNSANLVVSQSVRKQKMGLQSLIGLKINKLQICQRIRLEEI